MSDDFGTMNARRGERTREIEILREHYRRHREALHRMISDAPTQHLASEYERLLADIDNSLIKLDELEGISRAVPPAAAPRAAAPVTPAPRSPAPSRSRELEPERPHGDPLRAASQPGMRPLVSNPGGEVDGDDTLADYPADEEEPRSRAVFIVIIAIIALALIGWLIWRSGGERATSSVVEEVPPVVTETEAVEPPPDLLIVTPAEHDYGVIRKGTRATRRFEIANNTEQPVSIQIQRSACRCLYYEYAEVVPPKGKESITVTIDGARAPAGVLRETVNVTVKSDPTANTAFGVNATIQ